MSRPKKQPRTEQNETAETAQAADAPVAEGAPKRARDNYVFAPHKHPDYPDGPDLDPRYGDRTPEFATWLNAKNHNNQTES